MSSWLTINRACNLRCEWCYGKGTGFSSSDNMTMETVDKSISFLKDISMNAVILIGGEPTIHPYFFDIVRRIKEAGLEVYVVSNATPFSNKRFLEKTIEAGVSSITVSLKAGNAEDYLMNTGKNSFGKVLKAIRNISQSGISSVVNVTVCEGIIERFDELLEVVDGSGAVAFSIDTGKPVIEGGITSSEETGSPKVLAKFFKDVYPKLKNTGLRISVKFSLPFCLVTEDFIEEIIDDGNLLTGCQMVTGRGIIIDPKGYIIPCNHVYDQKLGRIGDDFSTADEYLSFRQRTDVVKFYDVVSAAPHKNCLQCKYWKMCGAGCKLNWLHYGESELIGNFT